MLLLIIAALVFALLHIGVAGTRLRDALVGALGEGRYMALFSLASVASLVWLVIAFGNAPYVETWGHPIALKPIALVTMIPALALFVIGVSTPSPTAVGGQRLLTDGDAARGILRITRHPFLWGVALWALTHLVINGDLAGLIFFGGLLVICVAGPFSIDAKRRRLAGPGWLAFAAKSSNFPFIAIIEGRNRLALGEIKSWQWLAVLVAYALILGGHVHVFGLSPFP